MNKPLHRRAVAVLMGVIMGLAGVVADPGESVADTRVPSPAARSIPISLPEAVATALRQNPDLKAVRLRIGEAEAREIQAGIPGNPELEVKSLGGSGSRKNLELDLIQPFAFSGRLRAAREVAGAELAATRWEIGDTERELARRIAAAFARLLALQEDAALQDELIASAEELLVVMEKALGQAQVSEAHRNSAAIELQRARSKKAKIETQGASLGIEFNRLIGAEDVERRPMGNLEMAVPGDDAYSTAFALEHRPDVRVARERVRQARLERSLAEKERWADVGVGIAYEKSSDLGGTEDTYGFKIAAPLPLVNRARGRIREAALREDRAGLELRALEVRVRGECRDALQRLRAAAAQLDRYRSGILERSRENIEIARAGYLKGLNGMTEILQARQQHLDLKSAWIELLLELRLAAADAAAAHAMEPAP